jgi:cobalt-zinc-cadmium efflux system outer membrane protein
MSFISWRGRAAALLGACAVVMCAPAKTVAQESTRDVIDLAQALSRAAAGNPDLAAFAPARRAAEGRRLQAGLYPNPDVGAEFEDFGGSGVERGVQALQTTLSLSQLIPLGDKLAKGRAVAQAGIEGVDADYAVAQLDVLAETARRYIDAAEAQARVDLADRSTQLAQQTLVTVRRAVTAGATSSAEINRASVALTRVQLDAERARSDLDAARIALAAMWGDTAPDFARVGADLATLPTLISFDEFAAALARSPQIARFDATSRLREAELRLAQAQTVPDLTVSAGLRRLEHGATGTDPDYGLVASLSLPLKLFDRNQGEVAAAHARIDQVDAERKAAMLRTRTVLYGLYHADRQVRARASRLSDSAVPQADEALKLIERGYRFGRFSLLDLLDAQRQAIGLRADVIAAQADAHRLDVELERLSAQPVVAPLPAAVSFAAKETHR